MKHNLTAHLKRHEGIFPAHCPVCGKGVYSNQERDRHIALKHQDWLQRQRARQQLHQQEQQQLKQQPP